MLSSKLDINKIKEEISAAVVDKVVNDIATTDEEVKILKEEMLSKINKSDLITEVNTNQYEVKSSELNKNFNELYIDLLTTYGLLNNINSSISSYDVSNLIYTDFIKAKINEINDKFESCSYALTSTHVPSYVIERFRNANNFDKKRELQKDRYGQWIPSKCYVDFNSKENYITLPLIKKDNTLRYDNKVATGRISTYFQLGRGFVDLLSNGTSIDNAIDESDTSFWHETILSDAPFRVSFDEEKPNQLFVDDNYFYGIENGAVCELEINFESLNTVNEISLDPYTKYPINIVAIRYKTTDDEDEPLVELVTPDNKDTALREVFTNSKVSYRFPDILCKKIYILFTQEHYIRDTYIYNVKDVYKNDLWYNSTNNKADVSTGAIFKPNYIDREELNVNFKNFNDRIVSSADNDITNIIIDDERTNRKVIKYEYSYGFYNIGCFSNHFDRTGIYVAKGIKVDSNIKSLSINTEEVHQLDSLGNSVTDIEYYVTSSTNPTENDWTPILPSNVNFIKSEMLYITGGTRAYLRFEADEVYSVMKNGEEIPADSNEYELDTNERTGNIFCVQIFNYDYDAVYSISYKPVAGSNKVDFSNKISTSIESFTGKGNNYFKLENFPYLDRNGDYCNIKLVNTSPDGAGENIIAENVTNIENQSFSYKNFDYSANKFQYYINEDTIYFNKPIGKEYIVDISYMHLISSIKLKAILRRNTTKDGWLTPVLKEIKYDIETF